ncbi:hypothetical protein KsCSTR_19910 [Candidatus Kuenenia stuttgartiensis]|jgi:hypothetical protein|uniref:Uncharacterized protein n=1 Tax=Kuenenia stuttgartiensis TaxID=174633 RepID=Q1Q2N0_KUEST|nr:hypothetical protein KsCSTR_19910 [Candidatus Kuenenia stuttgartiensis]TVM01470.1 MAG: hypothetical protein CV080_04485 [Candidatus Kuenenia stuttgartiensis]CAJ74269.1 unknown protein [Candidatus Kuenenia stuttgartiensis]
MTSNIPFIEEMLFTRKMLPTRSFAYLLNGSENFQCNYVPKPGVHSRFFVNIVKKQGFRKMNNKIYCKGGTGIPACILHRQNACATRIDRQLVY